MKIGQSSGGADAPVRPGIPRPVEALLSLIALAIACPLIALAGLVVVCTSRGPLLFRQRRVGRRGRVFTLYKLRTMRPHVGGVQVTACNDARITPVGRFLRTTKLDEIPELWNVLRGEMSWVGPRPEVPAYVDYSDPRWQVVLEARPGLTDPVTLRLRNEEQLLAGVKGSPEKFYLENLQPYKLAGYLSYLQRRTWKTDVSVLIQTARAVLSPRRAPPPSVEDVLRANAKHAPPSEPSLNRIKSDKLPA